MISTFCFCCCVVLFSIRSLTLIKRPYQGYLLMQNLIKSVYVTPCVANLRKIFVISMVLCSSWSDFYQRENIFFVICLLAAMTLTQVLQWMQFIEVGGVRRYWRIFLSFFFMFGFLFLHVFDIFNNQQKQWLHMWLARLYYMENVCVISLKVLNFFLYQLFPLRKVNVIQHQWIYLYLYTLLVFNSSAEALLAWRYGANNKRYKERRESTE